MSKTLNKVVDELSALYGECTKCDKYLEAVKGDIIVIYPQWLLNEWRLIVLCKPCFDELEREE